MRVGVGGWVRVGVGLGLGLGLGFRVRVRVRVRARVRVLSNLLLAQPGPETVAVGRQVTELRLRRRRVPTR